MTLTSNGVKVFRHGGSAGGMTDISQITASLAGDKQFPSGRLVPFSQENFSAPFRGADSRHHPGRPGADNNRVIVHYNSQSIRPRRHQDTKNSEFTLRHKLKGVLVAILWNSILKFNHKDIMNTKKRQPFSSGVFRLACGLGGSLAPAGIILA